MPLRPRTGQLVPLLLLVATTAALLASCALSTPRCEEGDALVAAGQPGRALEVYSRAQAQGDGCAEQGLQIASTNQLRAVEDAVRGEAAERAGDVATATGAYQAALALDVTNTLAVTGLARLAQAEPTAPPPVLAPPPSRSWWAGPWPYFLGSVLVSALLAGAVLWFVVRRLGLLTAAGAASTKRLTTMEQDRQSDQDRLNQLESHTRTGRAMINTLEQNTLNRAHTTDSTLRELHAVDAAADRARVKQDQELRYQRERIDQLTELIDLVAQTQAQPTSDTVVWLEPRPVTGAPAYEGGVDDEAAQRIDGVARADSAISAGAKRVEVNIFALTIGHGPGVPEQLVVQRVVERVVDPDAADTIGDPVWELVEESYWATSDYHYLADGMTWVKGIEDGWHDLVLGKPAEHVALGAGFSPAFPDVLAAIAAKVSLPGDSTVTNVRRLFQYTGSTLGVLSGAPPLANACISSLTHDLLAEMTAKAFRATIDQVLVPARREIRPIPADELGPDGTRATQLRSHLIDAVPRQQARELERYVPTKLS